jgi:hypothetical protein
MQINLETSPNLEDPYSDDTELFEQLKEFDWNLANEFILRWVTRVMLLAGKNKVKNMASMKGNEGLYDVLRKSYDKINLIIRKKLASLRSHIGSKLKQTKLSVLPSKEEDPFKKLFIDA